MSNIQTHLGVGGWPTCAVCNKPVERMEVWNDPMTFAKTYSAFCHGERQNVQITDFTLEDAHEIKFVRAFEREQLGSEA